MSHVAVAVTLDSVSYLASPAEHRLDRVRRERGHWKGGIGDIVDIVLIRKSRMSLFVIPFCDSLFVIPFL